MPEILDQTELDAELESLGGWEYSDRALRKTYKRRGFHGAAVFACYIAEIADSLNHHPDLHIHGYNKVTVSSTTHDAGGVTANDVALARRIDDMVGQD